jgi:hypothetical protein
VAPWRRKFSKLKVLFICYGTAVEHRSLLNRSGICDGINRCNIFHQGFIYMFIYMLRLRHFYGNEVRGTLRDTIQGPVIKYLCEKYVNYISFIELCMQINVREKFSKLKVLFICYGTAVEHRSLLNRSGICDGINRCNIFRSCSRIEHKNSI